MARIVIDPDLCRGHRVCEDEAPDVFRVGDDDLVTALVERPTPEQVERVKAACAWCPTGAIKLVEGE